MAAVVTTVFLYCLFFFLNFLRAYSVEDGLEDVSILCITMQLTNCLIPKYSNRVQIKEAKILNMYDFMVCF